MSSFLHCSAHDRKQRLVYYVNFLLLDITQWEVHKCLWKMLSTNQLCLHNLKMWLKKKKILLTI